MTKQLLGKLSQVALREIWLSEGGDFTPWLSDERNLQLLSETIGLELELVAREKSVGPFRADLLCRDTVTDSYVLIENQLEKTDHTHLGQLLTYAAGLNTVTIVWVAGQFTDEHRATMDWLNSLTPDEISFFGLEVEVWKIGDSEPAPKFNIVSKPNDWTKGQAGVRSKIDSAELFGARKRNFEYWLELKQLIDGASTILRSRKPKARYYYSFAVGRSRFRLLARIVRNESRLKCGLLIMEPHAVERFDLLRANEAEISSAFDSEVVWDREPDLKGCEIYVTAEFDPDNRSSWPQQHNWCKQSLEKMYQVFNPLVRGLPYDDDGDEDFDETNA